MKERTLKNILAALAGATVLAAVVVIVSTTNNAYCDEVIAQADEYIARYEAEKASKANTQAAAVSFADLKVERPTYTWAQEIIGKVVGFEVGNCCTQCKYMVASACINRYHDWYDRDVVAMITDGNEEYYQMNPDYLYSDECNGFNFWNNYTEIMQLVDIATYNPADVYYWDNADSQGEWAQLVWHCEKDGCWFYK